MNSDWILIIKTKNPKYKNPDDPEHCYRILRVENKNKYNNFNFVKIMIGWRKIPDALNFDDAFNQAFVLNCADKSNGVEVIEFNEIF